MGLFSLLQTQSVSSNLIVVLLQAHPSFARMIALLLSHWLAQSPDLFLHALEKLLHHLVQRADASMRGASNFLVSVLQTWSQNGNFDGLHACLRLTPK